MCNFFSALALNLLKGFFEHSREILFLASFNCLIQGHGFTANTLIQLHDNSQQTIESICINAKRKHIIVTSYDTNTSQLINHKIKKGYKSSANCHIKLGFNHDTTNNILCTPSQEFYTSHQHTWIPAYKLTAGDTLLTKNNNHALITSFEFITQPIIIYALEIKKSHTFFVGNNAILTHNVILPIPIKLGLRVPFGSVVAGGAGSFFGPITFIGGIIIGGLISYTFEAYYQTKLSTYITPDYDITSLLTYYSTRDDTLNTIKPNTCFEPTPKYNNQTTQCFPSIENSNEQKPTKCFELTENTNKPNICANITENQSDPNTLIPTQDNASTTQQDTKTRYHGPIARNWKEFERDCPIGQQHGKKFAPTGKQNPKDGSPIRQLSEDIPNTEMFKKDYFFAPDRLHDGDHFEVWDKNRKWIGVANLDGSQNHKKTAAEKDPIKRKLPR